MPMPATRGDIAAVTLAAIAGLWASVTLISDKIALAADPTYIPSCELGGALSCSAVINTWQASVFGFPNPLLGVAAYPLAAVAAALWATRTALPAWMWHTGAALASAGVIFTGWLITQSLFVIGKLCPWCLISWAATFTIATVYLTNYATSVTHPNTTTGALARAGRSLRWLLLLVTSAAIAAAAWILTVA